MSNLRTYLGYWLIEPIAQSYHDRHDSLPDLAYSHRSEVCGQIDVAVFLSTEARYLRVMVLNYSADGEKSPDKDDEIAMVVESVGAVIRLSFNGEAQFHQHVLSTTYHPKERHIIDILPKIGTANLPIKPEAFARGVEFSLRTIKNASILQLLVDAHDESIPLQFRYLSLYKILELLLKSNNNWDYIALNQYIKISGIDSEKPIGIEWDSKNWLHALRDKCAHFKNGEVLGVTMLDKETMRQISSAMPLIGRVVSVALGEVSGLFADLVSDTARQYELVESVSGKTLSES